MGVVGEMAEYGPLMQQLFEVLKLNRWGGEGWVGCGWGLWGVVGVCGVWLEGLWRVV